MPLVIPIGFAEIVFGFSFEGDPERMLTTFGVEVTGMPTQAELEDLGETFQNAFDEELADAVNLSLVRATVGTSGAPNVVEVNTDLAFTGTGNALPPNCALLLKKITESGGRANRGRMFVPGIRSAAVQENGVLGSSALANIAAAATAWLAAIPAISGTPFGNMVILHQDTSPTTTPTDVTTLSVSDRIATQRRRLRP